MHCLEVSGSVGNYTVYRFFGSVRYAWYVVTPHTIPSTKLTVRFVKKGFYHRTSMLKATVLLLTCYFKYINYKKKKFVSTEINAFVN
jgi:hypothetical protein